MSEPYFSYSGSLPDSKIMSELDAAIAQEFYLARSYVTGSNNKLVRLDCEKAKFGHFPFYKSTQVGEGTTGVSRTWDNIREDKKHFFLVWMPTRGSIKIQQNHHNETIDNSQFSITCTGLPFDVEFIPGSDRVHESILVALPAHVASEYLNKADQICGTAFDLGVNTSSFVQSTLLGLFQLSNADECFYGEPFIEAALKALTLLMQAECDRAQEKSCIKKARMKQIKEYIEFNLSSPGLTASKVAEECEISSRYVHLLFKDMNMNFHEYVWSRRLEMSHNWLSKGNSCHDSISEISSKSGFRSVSHFSRTFKSTYGYTPSQLKKQTIAAA